MVLSNNIISIDEQSPYDFLKIISQNVRERRLENNLTQEGLAKRAGIKLPTYRKFEQTGEISLSGLLRIAWALGVLEDFNQLFSKKQYLSIEEVISGGGKQRKRGKKK